MNDNPHMSQIIFVCQVVSEQYPTWMLEKLDENMPTSDTMEQSSELLSYPGKYTSKWNAIFERTFLQWITFKPKENISIYPCYSCRDMFSSKDSFLDHVNRRGMLITYNCPECKSGTLKFYNPCAFLLHTREHFLPNYGEIDLEEVNISSLPFGLAGFLQHPDVPLLFNVEADNLGENIVLNSRFYSPSVQSKGKRFVSFKPVILLFFAQENNPPKQLVLKQISANIPRCKFIDVLSEGALVLNATTNNPPEAKKDQNHTINYNANKATMSYNKLFEKYPRCPECNIVQKNEMIEHFHAQNKPTNEAFKCDECKYIAATRCSLSAHKRLHDSISPYVCPECGKNFEKMGVLLEHLEEVCFHLSKSVRYRCSARNCNKIFATPLTFATHFQMHLKVHMKCLKCDSLFDDEKACKEHYEEAHTNDVQMEKIFKCNVCQLNILITQANYADHVESHCYDSNTRVYVYNCAACRTYFRSRETYAAHIIRCTKRSSKPNKPQRLILSKQQEFKMRNTTPTNDTDGSTQTELSLVECILCNQEFTEEEMKQHIHGAEAEMPEHKAKKCKYTNPVVLLSKTSLEGQKRKRKSSSLNKHRRYSTNDIEIAPEQPVTFDGTYRCKLCDFENKERKTFHEHVVIHRDSTEYQCMECGECFVVKPSLSKHLNFIHQINNVDEYYKENECFNKKFEEHLNQFLDVAPVAENQCKVCRLKFNDEFELNKHFRVHGMAFLKKKMQ